MKFPSVKNWNKLSTEIHEFYSQFGKVNGVGQMADSIMVAFEKLNSKVTIKSIPKEYKGYLVTVQKMGPIVPLSTLCGSLNEGPISLDKVASLTKKAATRKIAKNKYQQVDG